MRKFLLLLVSVGLLAGGCGGSGGGSGSKTLSKSDYIKQITSILKTFDSAVTTLEALPAAGKAATALENVQSGLRSALPTLRAMKPPAEVAQIHTQLIKAVGEIVSELGPPIAKLKAGDASALAQVLQLKGVRDIEAVDSAFGKAGYQISL